MDWNRDDVDVGANEVVVVVAGADVEGNAKPEKALVVEAVVVDFTVVAAVGADVAAVVVDDPNGADPSKGTDGVEDAAEVEG